MALTAKLESSARRLFPNLKLDQALAELREVEQIIGAVDSAEHETKMAMKEGK